MCYYASLMETSKDSSAIQRYAHMGRRAARTILGMPAEHQARLRQLSNYIGGLPLDHGREQFANQLHEAKKRAVEAEFRRPFEFTVHTQHHKVFAGIMQLLGENAPTKMSELVYLADSCTNWSSESLQVAVEQVGRTHEPHIFAEESLHSAGGVRAYVTPTRLPHIVAAFNSPNLLKIESPRLDAPLHCAFFYVPAAFAD